MLLSTMISMATTRLTAKKEFSQLGIPEKGLQSTLLSAASFTWIFISSCVSCRKNRCHGHGLLGFWKLSLVSKQSALPARIAWTQRPGLAIFGRSFELDQNAVSPHLDGSSYVIMFPSGPSTSFPFSSPKSGLVWRYYFSDPWGMKTHKQCIFQPRLHWLHLNHTIKCYIRPGWGNTDNQKHSDLCSTHEHFQWQDGNASA